MKPYIKHQYQETAKHSKHNFTHCLLASQYTYINTQHLHNKTKVLPMGTNLKLHVTQTKTHLLYDLNTH